MLDNTAGSEICCGVECALARTITGDGANKAEKNDIYSFSENTIVKKETVGLEVKPGDRN